MALLGRGNGILKTLAVSLWWFLVVFQALAGSVTLQWDPNSEPDIAGYRAYYGTAPRSYSTMIDVGNMTTTVISNLSGGAVYYLAVTAYNTATVESAFSNEVQYAVPAMPPGIFGTVFLCSQPLADATLTLSGSVSASALSDSTGRYGFPFLTMGGNYLVVPSKARVVPGTAGIDTIDVIAVQRHYLNNPLTGCSLIAADIDGNGRIDTIDAVGIQRFAVGGTVGIADVGKYRFAPVNRTYLNLMTDQNDQDYDTVLVGDVVTSAPRGGLPPRNSLQTFYGVR